MSQYMDFYIRDNDRFIRIGSFSYDCLEYTIFKYYVPYEKVSEITDDLLMFVHNELVEVKELYRKNILGADATIKILKEMSGSVKERVVAIHEEENTINRHEQLLELAEETEKFLWSLEHLKRFSYDGSRYKLYVGIEAGDNPEIEE